MDDRRQSDPTRLGDLLGDTYDTLAGEHPVRAPGNPPAHGSGSLAPERMVAVVWPEVVGTEVAANTRPVQLRGKRLVVSTSSSVWAQTLQFMGASIAVGLNERLGTDAVDQIVFRHAGWEERSRGRTGGAVQADRVDAADGAAAGPSGTAKSADRGRAVALSEEQRAALAEVEKLDLAPELRQRMLRAMHASFVRGEKDSVR